ncbi:MAG: hypothetical protein ABI539_01665, partial [Acidobacteriota bacterium]
HVDSLSRWLGSDIEVEWPDLVLIYYNGLPLGQTAVYDGAGYNFVVSADYVPGSVAPDPSFIDLQERTADGKRKYRLRSINLKSDS